VSGRAHTVRPYEGSTTFLPNRTLSSIKLVPIVANLEKL
jgi:hypothetical protein